MLFIQLCRRCCLSVFAVLVALLLIVPPGARAQAGNAGSIGGTVKDPSGAAIQGADVTIANPVSGYQRTAKTDDMGQFSFANLPFNPYHLTVAAPAFNPYVQDVDVRSAAPVVLGISLLLGTAATTVTVSSGAEDLLETTSTSHTDVDRQLFDKVPLESQSSSVSSLVTLAAPGVAADSNGLFHGLGDHAENSFSIDGQPITDQQSKVFSNQIPADAIQSLEVIQGAPPAEYGDKTSLVINVTTRSGLGLKTPTGEVFGSFGSFQSANGGFNMGWGGDKWGNFVSVSGLNTNRFLDPPEATLLHDSGNQENIFDRVDRKVTPNDTVSLDFNFTRSWFQNPNSFDNLNAGEIDRFGQLVGPTNQRSQIRTFNLSPNWTRVIGTNKVLQVGVFARYDIFDYYPSGNPFADLVQGLGRAPDNSIIPVTEANNTISQHRTLLSTGTHADISWLKGRNNIKAGVQYMATVLTEKFGLGIVDPGFNAVCNAAGGSPDANPDLTAPSQCAGAGDTPNSSFVPLLGCFDLTRSDAAHPLPGSDGCPGSATISAPFAFDRHAVINEVAPFIQDTITAGPWVFNLGFRYDFYNGLSNASLPEPRAGVAYKVKKINTVLRFSYARTMETPFNENLILSSIGCTNSLDAAVLSTFLGCNAGVSSTLISPGRRNELHVGFEQAFGKYFVLNGEYIWKYTTGAYDFSTFGLTPITFPIEWSKSKIPGFAIRGSMPNFHGLSAFVVMSSVAARFFDPQIGGAGSVPLAGSDSAVFRIDHDERFNQTTHVQYQPWKFGPWFGVNWRYDSGLVAGQSPCFGLSLVNDCPQSDPILPNTIDMVLADGVTPMTADQEFQAGFTCNGVHATPTMPLPFRCPANEFGSSLISVPQPGAENDDHNPPRIVARHLFDLAIGDDDLFHHFTHSERYKWSARFTVINLANNTALYNFLSTFSGTHYVTPRTFTGELGFHF